MYIGDWARLVESKLNTRNSLVMISEQSRDIAFGIILSVDARVPACRRARFLDDRVNPNLHPLTRCNSKCFRRVSAQLKQPGENWSASAI